MQCSEIRSRLKVGVALIWCDTLSAAGIEFGGGDDDNVCSGETRAEQSIPNTPIVCLYCDTLCAVRVSLGPNSVSNCQGNKSLYIYVHAPWRRQAPLSLFCQPLYNFFFSRLTIYVSVATSLPADQDIQLSFLQSLGQQRRGDIAGAKQRFFCTSTPMFHVFLI